MTIDNDISIKENTSKIVEFEQTEHLGKSVKSDANWADFEFSRKSVDYKIGIVLKKEILQWVQMS